MSLSGQRACLEAVHKDIARRWEEVRTSWKDAQGREFDRQYMEQFMLLMERAAVICEKLDQIISKARHECE